MAKVAPPAGAWIEIALVLSEGRIKYRRSPCGSVD